MYSDYDSSIVTNRRFSPRVSMPSIFPGHTPDYSNDFESELADVFCYSCFDEGEKYIVKLKYDYIKHNSPEQRGAFRGYLSAPTEYHTAPSRRQAAPFRTVPTAPIPLHLVCHS